MPRQSKSVDPVLGHSGFRVLVHLASPPLAESTQYGRSPPHSNSIPWPLLVQS